MKKFINLSELKLQRNEMQNVVGGSDMTKPLLRYAVITPKYGIKPQLLYGIMPLYGIIALYGIIEPVDKEEL